MLDPESRNILPADYPLSPRSSYPLQSEPTTEGERPPVSPRPVVELSSEQQEVLDIVKSGRSVFFTGSAGVFPISFSGKVPKFLVS